MYTILVNIDFKIESKRKWSIKDGYRPLFKIPNKKSLFSGIINLHNHYELKPGEKCDARVSFFSSEVLNDLIIDSKLEFYEGANLVGYAIIKELPR
jgi:hypothetical protein